MDESMQSIFDQAYMLSDKHGLDHEKAMIMAEEARLIHLGKEETEIGRAI